jgi:hypothetical protein
MERRFSQVTAQDIARFWSKVAKAGPDDCWLWTGSQFKTRGKLTYGIFSFYKFTTGANQCGAHIFSFWLHNQRDPKPHLVCHSCNNCPCVNPKHLYLGTVQMNSADAAKHLLMNRGEAVNTAKLTAEIVVKIVEASRSGQSNKDIAVTFNIDRSVVSRILGGYYWKHVTEPLGIKPIYKPQWTKDEIRVMPKTLDC